MINKDLDKIHLSLHKNHIMSAIICEPSNKKIDLSIEIKQDKWEHLIRILLFTVIIYCYFVALSKLHRNWIEFIPLIILTAPIEFICFFKRKLTYLSLAIIEAGVSIQEVIPFFNKVNLSKFKILSLFDITINHHMVVRLLHPQFDLPHKKSVNKNISNEKFIFNWLNEYDKTGLRINILRSGLIYNFSNADFITKVSLGFQIHRAQILTYCLLLFFTGLIGYIEEYHLASHTKFQLRVVGITWWVSAIFLYRDQINRLKQWMEKSRDHSLSLHLPIYVWNRENECWEEKTQDELNKPYDGNYGVESEKFVTMTQTIFLAIYLTSLGLL